MLASTVIVVLSSSPPYPAKDTQTVLRKASDFEDEFDFLFRGILLPYRLYHSLFLLPCIQECLQKLVVACFTMCQWKQVAFVVYHFIIGCHGNAKISKEKTVV